MGKDVDMVIEESSEEEEEPQKVVQAIKVKGASKKTKAIGKK